MAVSNDMSGDQRVARHAAALCEAGCEVVVVCRKLDDRPPLEGDWKVVRLPLKWRKGWRFYAELNRKLRRFVAQERPDVVWANDTDTLPGCWLGHGKARLVMDAHELFPEVPELEGRPIVKWVWRTIERWLMPKCDGLLTVCQSIADYYRDRYGVKMEVVRNIAEGERLEVKGERLEFSILNSQLSNSHHTLLYQGAVNEGRGVDWAIDALELLPDCRLVVAGVGDKLEEMKAYARGKAWSERVLFLGWVAPSELKELTRQADVGLVMLEDRGLSYHYALPNRIGDFVAAGVPMVVSDLPEMAAVVRKFGVGEVIEIDNSKLKNEKYCALALAEAVKRVLAKAWSEEDFKAAREDMDWESEKEKVVEMVKGERLKRK